jgi:hypothetical protein
MRDYQFLGEAPTEYWWRSYGTVTDVEKPTILLESDGKYWKAYVAGIFSARRDAGNRQIQFNLVLDGACDDATARELALGVVTESAVGLAAERSDVIPGTRLDQRFPEGDVERMLTTPGEATREEAAEAVKAAYGSVSHPAAGDAPQAGDWVGGVANARARDQFTAAADRLLKGQRGRALLLNRFLGDGYVNQLPEWSGSVNVLLARPEQLDKEVSELRGKAEPAPALSPGPEPWPPEVHRKTPAQRGRILALVVLGILIVIAVIFWLTKGGSQRPPAQPTSPKSSPTPASSER